MAGPKGSGLALMIECLTSLLVSNPLIAEFLEETPLGLRHRQNGLAIAIDVGRFGDAGRFRAEVERMVRRVKALPRADGVEEILVPGERGARTFAKRTREGIPIPPAVWKELAALAGRLEIALPAASS
jgi:ureidoglycolate dehydrogenase (NAD+)